MRSTITVPNGVGVELENRRWFYTARQILMENGLDHIRVFIEPGDTVPCKQESSNWFLRLFGWTDDINVLGWYCLDDKTLHMCVQRSDIEVFDTLLHEVAHAMVHKTNLGDDHDHGPWWLFQFHLLKDQYREELHRLLAHKVVDQLKLAWPRGIDKYTKVEVEVEEEDLGVTRRGVITFGK
jgi:hypothetical protein